MAQLNIEIPDDMKADWKKAAAKNPEYNSLTHLISLSVANELDNADGTSGESINETMEVMDSIKDLRGDIDEVENLLKDVKLTVDGLTNREDIRNQILEALRNRTNVEGFTTAKEMWDEYDGEISGDEMAPPKEDKVGPKTSDDIAIETGIQIEKIERELDWLVDNYPHVDRAKLGEEGETWYVRTDDQKIDNIDEDMAQNGGDSE